MWPFINPVYKITKRIFQAQKQAYFRKIHKNFPKKSAQTTARARPTKIQLKQEAHVLCGITSGILPLCEY